MNIDRYVRYKVKRKVENAYILHIEARGESVLIPINFRIKLKYVW